MVTEVKESTTAAVSNVPQSASATPIERGITADELKKIKEAIDSAAVKISLSGNFHNEGFNGRLEKHLSDYRSGHGYLSKQTYGEVVFKDEGAANELAAFSPSSSKLYNVYKASFGYESQVRFVQGISQLTSNLKAISRKA